MLKRDARSEFKNIDDFYFLFQVNTDVRLEYLLTSLKINC